MGEGDALKWGVCSAVNAIVLLTSLCIVQFLQSSHLKEKVFYAKNRETPKGMDPLGWDLRMTAFCTQQSMERKCVVKLIDKEINSKQLKSIRKEMEAIHRLNHSNITGYSELFEDENQCF